MICGKGNPQTPTNELNMNALINKIILVTEYFAKITKKKNFGTQIQNTNKAENPQNISAFPSKYTKLT